MSNVQKVISVNHDIKSTDKSSKFCLADDFQLLQYQQLYKSKCIGINKGFQHMNCIENKA